MFGELTLQFMTLQSDGMKLFEQMAANGLRQDLSLNSVFFRTTHRSGLPLSGRPFLLMTTSPEGKEKMFGSDGSRPETAEVQYV